METFICFIPALIFILPGIIGLICGRHSKTNKKTDDHPTVIIGHKVPSVFDTFKNK